jgi:transposase-like protein
LRICLPYNGRNDKKGGAKMRKQRTYNDKDKEKAFALLTSGETCSQVAETLGIPYTTVKTWEKKWEEEGFGEDNKNLVEIRNQKKEEFTRNAWDIIGKANELLSRRIERALASEDEIDEIINEVALAGKATLQPEEKKHLFSKLRAIKVDDIREIATVIGTIYDKQALANKEATSVVEGGVVVEFDIPRPPKEKNEDKGPVQTK